MSEEMSEEKYEVGLKYKKESLSIQRTSCSRSPNCKCMVMVRVPAYSCKVLYCTVMPGQYVQIIIKSSYTVHCCTNDSTNGCSTSSLEEQVFGVTRNCSSSATLYGFFSNKNVHSVECKCWPPGT
jgi:hypothetical protein